jgi:putative membrane protein
METLAPARWLLAALHLTALGIGFAAIWTRARALGRLGEEPAYRRVLAADTAWGLAALLWIATGLMRAFGGYEKGTDYYLQHPVFWVKMALLGAVLLLELWPMVTFVRWRLALARGRAVDASAAPALARVSLVQAVLILAMVFAASAMARGVGGPG